MIVFCSYFYTFIRSSWRMAKRDVDWNRSTTVYGCDFDDVTKVKFT